ncbi:MAG: Gfo/Idh/MocA family protein [Promethearchaeota archaeon]
MRELKIGIIGAGFIGDAHAFAIKRIIKNEYFRGKADISINAICDIDENLAEKVGKRYSIPNIYTNYVDLIENSDTNAIFICTPTKYHYEMFLAAANAGKNIFQEKPIADSINKIDEMIRIRGEKGIIIQVGLILRFFPWFWYIKRMIEKNREKWGSLQNVIFRDDQLKPYLGKGVHTTEWRRNPDIAYHGTLFEHSIHDIDMLRYWLGDIKNVFAHVKFFAGVSKIEDSVSVLFELVNGGSATLNSIWHNVNHDARYIEIFFENAYLAFVFGDRRTSINIWEAGSIKKRIKFKEFHESYKIEMGINNFPSPIYWGICQEISFFRKLINNEPANPSLEDAKVAHQIVDACYLSAKEGKVIEIKN